MPDERFVFCRECDEVVSDGECPHGTSAFPPKPKHTLYIGGSGIQLSDADAKGFKQALGKRLDNTSVKELKTIGDVERAMRESGCRAISKSEAERTIDPPKSAEQEKMHRKVEDYKRQGKLKDPPGWGGVGYKGSRKSDE